VTWTPRTSSGSEDGFVTADVGRDHTADDSRCDQREQRAGRDEPMLVPPLTCLCASQLVARVGIDRLKDVPRGQGVEN